ncbi:MAG: amidohydrolase family protein, partial [Chloroflexota bacterium]|nr:amidohydrolase family protein [Chloroflexota bacterium]
SQVHSYDKNSPERPWAGTLDGPDSVTGDQMVEAMDAAGVDGALLVSPFSMYRYDPSYALEVHSKHPTRFGLIKPFDPHSDSVAEEVAEWARTPGVVGARLMLTRGDYEAGDPAIDRLFDAAGRAGVPLNVMASGKLSLFRSYAERHPDTQLVIDHVGLLTYNYPPIPDEPFADVPLVASLAELDHVAIKISAACTLSHEPFPYPDIWEPLRRLFDAFGIERCMWGTDWTRTVGLLTYKQGVDAFRVTGELSGAERAALMGGSLSRIYGWSPGAAS